MKLVVETAAKRPGEEMNIMNITSKTSLHVWSLLAVSGMVGCATTQNLNELDDARAEVQRVESNPLAGEYAPKEVELAHNLLLEAERLAKEGKSPDDIRQNAYLAKRHAQIATEQIGVAQARDEIRKAEGERERIVSEARANEARAAAGQATAARQQAELATQQAELTAEEAQRRAQLLQDELEQLKAKKTDRGFVLTLGDVLFDTGKATLKPGARTTTERLGKFLQDSPERTIIIEGHTDSVGSGEYNQDLSQRRADAVRTALLERGVAIDRIQSLGKGEDYPVASNDDSGGRQQNRRVEVVISETAEDRNAQTSSGAGGPRG